jgi:hypothetical protein
MTKREKMNAQNGQGIAVSNPLDSTSTSSSMQELAVIAPKTATLDATNSSIPALGFLAKAQA